MIKQFFDLADKIPKWLLIAIPTTIALLPLVGFFM
jgi:hypothetical protein